jgi:hypothetical protein
MYLEEKFQLKEIYTYVTLRINRIVDAHPFIAADRSYNLVLKEQSTVVPSYPLIQYPRIT